MTEIINTYGSRIYKKLYHSRGRSWTRNPAGKP